MPLPLFLFDNCIAPQVAKALELVEVQALHVQNVSELGSGATDSKIAAWCQRNRAVWVTADLKASKRRRVQAIPALARISISIAFFKSTAPGWTRRQWLLQVLKRIDEMEELYDVAHPVRYRFTARGRPKPL